MESASWKFILVNSNDLSAIGQLNQARGKSLSLSLNKPGSLTFTYPFSADHAEDIEVISTGVMAYRQNSKTLEYKLIWSGYINEITDNASDESMTVSVVGWFERLNKRIAKADVLYTSQLDKDVILGTNLVTPSTTSGITCSSGIIHLANQTQSTSYYTIPSGSYPSGAYPLQIVSGSNPNTLTWIRPGTYDDSTTLSTGAPTAKNIKISQDESFGETITKLTEFENGPDIEVDPETRELNVYLKKGNVKSIYFAYNWGPSNIKEFSKRTDLSIFANNLVGRSNGVAPVMLATASGSLSKYGIFENVINLNQNAANQKALEFFTAAEYLFTSEPLISYSITPYPYTTGSAVPEPFVDYDIGDQVKFRAIKAPRIDESGSFRIFGMSVSIGDDGNETIGELQIYYNG